MWPSDLSPRYLRKWSLRITRNCCQSRFNDSQPKGYTMPMSTSTFHSRKEEVTEARTLTWCINLLRHCLKTKIPIQTQNNLRISPASDYWHTSQRKKAE